MRTIQAFPSCQIPVIFTIWMDSANYPYGLCDCYGFATDDQLRFAAWGERLGLQSCRGFGSCKGDLGQVDWAISFPWAGTLPTIFACAIARSRDGTSPSAKPTAAFQLIDLESHNGTFVNGIPVRRKLLTHGDTIRVGRCELVFLITDEAEDVIADGAIPRGRAGRPADDDQHPRLSVRYRVPVPMLAAWRATSMHCSRSPHILNSIRDLEELQQRCWSCWAK